MLFLEDLYDGREFELGDMEVTREAMIRFSEQFDPQAFHLDDKVGEQMFGGIIASGWHTASICHRLMVDSFLSKAACMASPGVEDLKFVKPVYAGDLLTGKLVVESSRVSTTKPDRGVIKLRGGLTRQDGQVVLSMVGNVIIGCRPT